MPIILNGTTGITTPGITNTGPTTFQGVVELPAGTVGAPSLTTTGDTNTGIYFPAADTIGFVEGGVEVMRINSSSNVGIGTTSPVSRLHVDSSATNTAITVESDLDGGSLFTSGLNLLRSGVAAGSRIQSLRDAGVGGVGLNFLTTADNAAEVAGTLTSRMVIDRSGNVGIGTASPARRLSVNGNAELLAGGAFFFNNAVNTASSSIVCQGGGSMSLRSYGVEMIALSENTTLVFSTNSAERARIDSSGNLLVGTTSSFGKLTINSNGAPASSGNMSTGLTVGNGTGGTAINIGTNDGGGYNYIQSAYINNAGVARSLAFFSGATQAMTLDASGNLGVGLGAATPSTYGFFATSFSGSPALAYASILNSGVPYATPLESTLYIGGARTDSVDNGNIAGYRLKSYTPNSTSAYFAIEACSRATGSGSPPNVFTERARIDSSGNLLINTTDVDAGISGNVTKTQFSFRAASEGFRMSSTGSAYYNVGNAVATQYVYWKYAGTTVGNIAITSTATAYNTSSDRRLKDNIVPAPSASSVIDAIEVVSHDWKVGGHTRYGMIAQDLYTVAPEAVSVGDADDVEELQQPWGVDYSKLVPMLVKEIQSLRQRVAQLEVK